jgi:hypothetical protein
MCDCIERINKDLQKDNINTRITTPILFNYGTGMYVETKALIATEKTDTSKREKAKRFFATYCPFCGVKYPEAIPEKGGDGYLK